MSRLRGTSSSIKETSKIDSYSRDCFFDEQDHRARSKSCKNGTDRYHFGMSRQKEEGTSKDSSDRGNRFTEDPDLLYKKSKEHFASWDIKDIVEDDSLRSRKQTETFEKSRLTNGRSKNDSTRMDRYDDRDESSNDRGRVGSIERDQAGSHRSRRKEHLDSFENSKASGRFVSSRHDGKDDSPRNDERERLLREIENLAVDGRSPDRRIRAMIERFKSREEDKVKSRRDYSSPSPDREEHRSKVNRRNEIRTDRIADNDDRDRSKSHKDDRDGERRSFRSKSREPDKFEAGETNRNRADKFNDVFEKRNDSSILGHRKFREVEDDVPSRRKDSPKRRSYVYEGDPEDFDVRIQRYERAHLEPKRDSESFKRVPLKDSDADLDTKDSLKDRDRHTSRKSSFKSGDQKKSHHCSKDRESGLSRKTSFKDEENGVQRKNSLKTGQDVEKKYFGRDPNHVSRRNSFKQQQICETDGKNTFKEQSTDYGRISSKNRDNGEERRGWFKEPTDGVSRITFKEHDCDSDRIHSCRNQESDIARVSFKEPSADVARKNSLKEKTVEFAGISYKDRDEDDEDRRKFDNETRRKISPRKFEEAKRKQSPNGRYVEFGSVSFQQDEHERSISPVNERDYDPSRRTSMNEPGDSSLSKKRGYSRNKIYENVDKRSGKKSPSPSKQNDSRFLEEDREEFDSKSWHESNRVFAVNYLRENSRYRSNPEGLTEIEQDQSQETRPQEWRERKSLNEGFCTDEIEEPEIYGNPNNATDHPRDVEKYTRDKNGATIIRIRSSPETSIDRRRRRRPVQESQIGRRRRCETHDEEDTDEDEELDRRQNRRDNFLPGRSLPTPSRRIWNYREGGVVITDVEDGQPCLQCEDTCSGFSPHAWRKNCTSCKCPREAHDVRHEEWVSVRSRLGLKGEESSSQACFDPRSKGLAWAPPGLPAHKVEEYFSMLPEVSVPRLGTVGERHRDRQLAIQLPKQDLARAYCRHLNPKHASSADDFMAARNEIALDIGTVQEVLETDIDCGACRTPLKYGSLAVWASKLGLLYHPACFRCTECNELLVDLAYCVHNDTLFCERHYAEQLKARCAACDELIFSGEYTTAMNKDWHSGHFCCWQCDESLTGQRYVLRDEHPYCIKCYESVFANGCEECNKIIGIDSKDLSYKDKHWHEACFLCNRCRVSLVDKQFGSKVDKIYCGNCYDAQFASRCDGCGEIFRAGTKKMEYKTRQWHEKCFCCVVCKNPIGTKSFIPREQEIYCAGCYEDKFATRCVKCKKIITSGGVTYKNEPWHRDCFTCSNCNNSLAGQRFTSRDDKPYCADCFGELFAKRCTACSKPITGIGGTRFISFEDRHWHNDCFICAGCKTSLVGRGFITDAEDIICPDCAKMKLM